MKHTFQSFAIIIITVFNCSFCFAVRKEILFCVGAQGDCVAGDVTIGSASDKFSPKEINIDVQNLSTIKTTKETELTLPASGQKIIAFTPTKKQYANQQIKLLFYAFNINNIPAELSDAKFSQEIADIKTKHPEIKSVLKVYYKLPEQNQWTYLLTSFNEKPITALKPLITVDSEAKLFYYPQPYTDTTGNLVRPAPITYDLNTIT
ncbi:MAG: hypothetical protein AB7F19_04780 [Candidatus Babeliales bacterium]